MTEQLEKRCARPGCGDAEFRIDGYCSNYCRDIHEVEQERDELLGIVRDVASSSAIVDGDSWDACTLCGQRTPYNREPAHRKRCPWLRAQKWKT